MAGHEGSDAADVRSSAAVKDVLYGCVAGCTSKLFEHPFDLVKVRLQSQFLLATPKFAGPADCFRQTWTKEGWRGLYRGLSMPLIGAMAENSMLFLVYNQVQRVVRSTLSPNLPSNTELPISQKAIAAGAAGACASFILTPIELVKCRMQVQVLAREGLVPREVAVAAAQQSSSRPDPMSTISSRATAPGLAARYSTSAAPIARLPGPFAIVSSTLKKDGVRGLWLGQTGTLLREVGGAVAWFSTFEIVSQYFIQRRQSGAPASAPSFTKKDLSSLELMTSGACSGIAYNVILFPADSIKSAIQTREEMQGGNAAGPRPSFIATGLDIWRKRGLKGLYAGMGITVARSAPSSAMIFLVYSTCEKIWG